MGASMGPWPGHRPRGPSAPLRLRHSARRPLSWRKPQKTLPCQNEESDPRRQKRTALSEVDPADQQEAIRLPTRRREQRPSLPLLKRKRTGRGTRRAPCRSYGEIQIGFASRTPPSSAMASPLATGRQPPVLFSSQRAGNREQGRRESSCQSKGKSSRAKASRGAPFSLTASSARRPSALRYWPASIKAAPHVSQLGTIIGYQRIG